MKFEEFESAFNDAQSTLWKVDHISQKLAEMLIGRLRLASKTYAGARYVAKLKRELRDFNMQTLKWKD
jgi:hypothetical protein